MIRKRLDTYHEKTEPLIDYYESAGLLKRVDGDQPSGGGHATGSAPSLATLKMEEEA